jgi:hypothetical protein
MFSSSRLSALTTRTPVIFSLYAPVILELSLRTGGTRPGSSCGTGWQSRPGWDDRQHDQGQAPVDNQHEDGGGGDIHDRPGDIQQTPGHQVSNPFRVGGDPRHDPATGVRL